MGSEMCIRDRFIKSSHKYTLDDLERLNLFPNGEKVNIRVLQETHFWRKGEKVNIEKGENENKVSTFKEAKEGKVKEIIKTETKTENLQNTTMSVAEKHYTFDNDMENESHSELEPALSDSWLVSIEEEERKLLEMKQAHPRWSRGASPSLA